MMKKSEFCLQQFSSIARQISRNSTSCLPRSFIFTLLLMFFSFSSFASQVSETKRTESEKLNPKIPANLSLSEKQIGHVRKLIHPFEFNEKFFKDWRFHHIQKYDKTDIVISLVNDDTSELLFVWLTRKDDNVPHQGQSRNFNIVCVAENAEKLNSAQKEVADKVIELTKKNDAADTALRKKMSDKKGGLSVDWDFGNKGNTEFRATNKLKNILWGIALVFLSVIILAIIYKVIRKTARKSNP